MTIRTASLESRFLIGDRPLFDNLQTRYESEIVSGTAAEFVAAKLAEREQRVSRAGSARLSRRTECQRRQGWLAWLEHALLDRKICLSRSRYRRAGNGWSFQQGRTPTLFAL